MNYIFGLSFYEITTTADVQGLIVTLDILVDTNSFLPVIEYTFLSNKGYDMKNIYHQVHTLYHRKYIIPLNKKNEKNPKLLSQSNPIYKTDPTSEKTVNFPIGNEPVKNSTVC